jgi:hypothetical protein
MEQSMNSYRSDRQIVQDLLPIRLFGAVIIHGIDEPEGDVAKEVLALLRDAEADVIRSVLPKKVDAILRRSWRLHDAILKPFQDSKAAVAKFGLVVFYVLDNIRRHGQLNFPEGGPLDSAITAILAEDGTISEFANVKPIDDSAQKQARKVFALIQAEGFFPGMAWE